MHRINGSFRPTRRQLLGATAAAATASLASRFGVMNLAHAQAMTAQTKRRFLFVYFPAGFDQLLFLDPRDPAQDAQRSTFLTDVRYDQLDGQQGFVGQVQNPNGAPETTAYGKSHVSFGPAVHKSTEMARPRLSDPAIARHVSIVRGMNMGTVAHDVGFRYWLTGTFPAGNSARGSSLPTQIASLLGSTAPLPSLSLRIESYNERFEGKYSALRVNSLEDLNLVLQREPGMLEGASVEQALDEYASSERPCEVNVFDRRGILTKMRNANASAQNILNGGLASKFQFLTDPSMNGQEIRRQYFGSTATVGTENSPAARAAFAATAIKTGVAQCLSVMLGNGTDTHFSNNLDHASRLYPGVSALAALIDDLAKSDVDPALGLGITGKWIEHTTIIGFSEFSRTPLLNQFGGRDHHITSSCLLAGAGIKGDTVVGQSSDVAMGSCLYDFEAGRLSDTGKPIKPENVATTLIKAAGLDPGDHRFDAAIAREPPINELLLPR